MENQCTFKTIYLYDQQVNPTLVKFLNQISIFGSKPCGHWDRPIHTETYRHRPFKGRIVI